jgi:hypothetical protein
MSAANAGALISVAIAANVLNRLGRSVDEGVAA